MVPFPSGLLSVGFGGSEADGKGTRVSPRVPWAKAPKLANVLKLKIKRVNVVKRFIINFALCARARDIRCTDLAPSNSQNNAPCQSGITASSHREALRANRVFVNRWPLHERPKGIGRRLGTVQKKEDPFGDRHIDPARLGEFVHDLGRADAFCGTSQFF